MKSMRTAAKTHWECCRIGLAVAMGGVGARFSCEINTTGKPERNIQINLQIIVQNVAPSFCNSYNPKLEHFNKIKDLSPPKLE
jgi:hypothetical protein